MLKLDSPKIPLVGLATRTLAATRTFSAGAEAAVWNTEHTRKEVETLSGDYARRNSPVDGERDTV